MPRFFFHFEDDAGRLRDRQGAFLPDAEAAWYQGVRTAREVAEIAGRIPVNCRIAVEDEEGMPICDVAFEDVVTLH